MDIENEISNINPFNVNSQFFMIPHHWWSTPKKIIMKSDLSPSAKHEHEGTMGILNSVYLFGRCLCVEECILCLWRFCLKSKCKFRHDLEKKIGN